jgi:hypothetical protein
MLASSMTLLRFVQSTSAPLPELFPGKLIVNLLHERFGVGTLNWFEHVPTIFSQMLRDASPGLAFDFVTGAVALNLFFGRPQQALSYLLQFDESISPEDAMSFQSPSNLETRARLDGYAYLLSGNVTGASERAASLGQFETHGEKRFSAVMLDALVHFASAKFTVSSVLVHDIHIMLRIGAPRIDSLIQLIPVAAVPLWLGCELLSITLCNDRFAEKHAAILELLEAYVRALFILVAGNGLAWMAGAVLFWHGRHLEFSGRMELGRRAIHVAIHRLQAVQKKCSGLAEPFIAQIAFHLSGKSSMVCL